MTLVRVGTTAVVGGWRELESGALTAGPSPAAAAATTAPATFPDADAGAADGL